MKILLEKKSVTIGFVIAVLIFLVINYLAYRTISERFEDEKYISEAFHTITICEDLLTALTEASANRRGYLITSSGEFLTQYNSAIRSVDSLFTNLRSLPSNNAKEMEILDTLSPLISTRKDLLEEAIELQQKAKSPAEQKRLTLEGQELQQRIKHFLSEIESEERTILEQRNSHLSRSSEFTIVILIGGTVASLLLLAVSFVFLTREINFRKRYEKDLRESRNWFLTTLTSIGDAVVVTNRYGDIQFMNPVAQELTGWKIEAAKGKDIMKVFNVINEDTREVIENPVARVLREGTVTGIANHSLLINYSGKEIPIDDSAAPVISGGRILGAVIVFRDITQRRKHEKEILDNQRFIQSIADSIPNILYLYDLRGPRVIYANSKVAEKLGCSPEEVRNLGSEFFKKYMHPNDYGKLPELFKKYIKASDFEILENEYRLKNASGEYRWFQSRDVVFTRDNDGIPIQMLGTALDITEQKKLQEEISRYYQRLEETVSERTAELRLINERLQQEILDRIKAEKTLVDAELKFRSLVEYSLAGIYIVQDNKFVYLNPKFEKIFGYRHGELIGKDISSIIPDESLSLVEENIRKRLQGEIQSIQYSYRARRKDGIIIDVETLGAVMEYRGRRAIIGTLLDISERKLAEDRIMKSLKEKELLLQEIHHRVKNNLQIIISLLKLQSKSLYDDRDLEIFNKSRARVETMALIHENLYRSSDLANIDIGTYLTNLTLHLLQVYGIESELVEIRLTSDGLKLSIDTAIPCGLLVNELVSNSLKYAFPNLQSAEKGQNVISIDIRKYDGNIILTVGDNGIGLPGDLDVKNTKTMGMQLIMTLVNQLEGKLEIVGGLGTTYKITFSELKYSQRY